MEKTESVFEISLYVEESNVKLFTCTFRDAVLSKWDGHTKTLGIANANTLSWGELKQMIIEE